MNLLAVLACWFRLKYPHVAIGAVASSAPILQLDHITPWSSFYDAVSQDFKVNKLPFSLPLLVRTDVGCVALADQCLFAVGEHELLQCHQGDLGCPGREGGQRRRAPGPQQAFQGLQVSSSSSFVKQAESNYWF